MADQLMMRVSLDQLPELRLTSDYTLHTEQANSADTWEWIVENAFGRRIPYSTMRAEPSYAPDRVYFIKEHAQDMATAAAFYRDAYPGEGYLHMVAAHGWGKGSGAGRLATLAALLRFREDGMKTAVLTTDDFRLSAIHMYLSLGFKGVILDDEHAKRWEAVMEKLNEHKREEKAALPLWPGKAPYEDECAGQAAPSLAPFPVEGARGAVVVCPGGGYHFKACHEGAPIARMINAAGVAAYVLDYRVNPCPFEAPLSDAKRAIRLVRSLGYEKVAILGFSAGGHLCCSAATLYDAGDPESADPVERLSSRPDAFIPCYAVVSFASFRHQGSLEQLLGDRAADISLIRRFSAELHVDGDTPPAFIWHTAADATVPVENSLMLASALAHAGVPFELHVFPLGNHGLGLAGGNPSVGQWCELCQKWLLGLGFGA